MEIELLKDYRLDGVNLFKKGTIANVHPSDGIELIKKKIAIEFPKPIKLNENGSDNRKD